MTRLAGLLLVAGILLSDRWQHPLLAVAFFSAASFLLTAAGAPFPFQAPARPFSAMLWASAGLALLVVLLKPALQAAFPGPVAPYSLDMYFLARPGIANDIQAAAFSGWGRLWAIALLAGLSLAWLRWSLESRREALVFGGLLVLAFFIKLAVAHLADGGMLVLGQKIESKNNGYFHVLGIIDEIGPWEYLRHFQTVQKAFGYHVDTHPFFPGLAYWLIRKVAGHSPLAVGLWVAGINALTAPLLALLGWRLTGSRLAALAAGLLWASSPLNAILSSSGADAFAALAVAALLLAFDFALEGEWSAWPAGLAFLAATLFSYSAILLLLFVFLWAWRERSGGAWALSARVALPALAAHLLLWIFSAGSVNYLASMSLGLTIHQSMNAVRIYEIWSWLNVFLYCGFAGCGMAVAAILAFAGKAQGRLGSFLSAAWPFLALLVLSALGKAEVQRQFIFGGLFLALAAAALLASLPLQQQFRGCAFLVLLGFAHCAALEILVVDQW